MPASSARRKAVHFGTDQIGCGAIAPILHLKGFELVFVDPELPDQSRFRVTVRAPDSRADQRLEIPYSAVCSRMRSEAQSVTSHLEQARLVLYTFAQSAHGLDLVAARIAESLPLRPASLGKLTVIVCQQLPGLPRDTRRVLKDLVHRNCPSREERSKVVFTVASIDRFVQLAGRDRSIDMEIENYCDWYIDRGNQPPCIPEGKSVRYVNDIAGHIELNHELVQTGRAIIAYYGHVRGKQTMHAAAKDATIRKVVAEALTEAVKLHHAILPQSRQKAFVAKLLTRFANPIYQHSPESVGKEPLQVLKSYSHLLGPIIDLDEQHLSYSSLLIGVEVALRFRNVAGDQSSRLLDQMMLTRTPAQVASDLLGDQSDGDQRLLENLTETVRKAQSLTRQPTTPTGRPYIIKVTCCGSKSTADSAPNRASAAGYHLAIREGPIAERFNVLDSPQGSHSSLQSLRGGSSSRSRSSAINTPAHTATSAGSSVTLMANTPRQLMETCSSRRLEVKEESTNSTVFDCTGTSPAARARRLTRESS